MSAVDEQRQTTAIRAALGTTDAEVTRAPGGGWLVRISDERAKLALDLYDRLGDAASADTFVVSTEDGDQMEGWTLPAGTACAVASALAGGAADRERYVTERAEALARALISTAVTTGRVTWQAGDGPRSWDRLRGVERADLVSAFRDLIDRGVLK